MVLGLTNLPSLLLCSVATRSSKTLYSKMFSLILLLSYHFWNFYICIYFVSHQFLSYSVVLIHSYIWICIFICFYIWCVFLSSIIQCIILMCMVWVRFTFIFLLLIAWCIKPLKYLLSDLINMLKSLTLVYLKCIHSSFPDDSSCLFFLYKHCHLPMVLGHLNLLFRKPLSGKSLGNSTF